MIGSCLFPLYKCVSPPKYGDYNNLTAIEAAAVFYVTRDIVQGSQRDGGSRRRLGQTRHEYTPLTFQLFPQPVCVHLAEKNIDESLEHASSAVPLNKPDQFF